MQSKIKVGFIGLNPDSHWAATAHLPALSSLSDDFEIVGVANSSYASAQRTAKALELPFAFQSPAELVCSDEIDLVVVTVKVPHHFELVSLALNAGKHVHCEWPLGNGLEEAKKLAALAAEKGVVATVGTQMRTSVEVKFLQKLIKDGYVGDVLSSSLIGSGANWGGETSEELAYLYDKTTGATMLTIPFAHTLAGLQTVLGEIVSIGGQLGHRRKTVRVTDADKEVPFTAADQILAYGQFASGAAFSAHYRGGMSKATNFFWEINGTRGDLQITGNIGHGQFANLNIKGATGDDDGLQELTVPAEFYNDLPDSVIARNVAGIYKLIASDIRRQTRSAPSFADAVQLHSLLDVFGQG
ncbi:Gfo/Idh/MocA family protein [Alteromonas lipolytica]|uniref:Oxidoreductase n=1 Tax=Alteromonas lipolytica TaxID=1856405 RepID=A0A1E8F8F1_9ALTE|nr:Gfo/Idh/MocA family oxidoreductase [Alteromonas lipolytica]OFI32190.1 oxidoreductase [Alteromonas lipolytica]GGF83153.1 oxidoreductase [Alteromonas lipolytica]